MREYKHRGKCINEGELKGKWVYGDLLQKNGKYYISPHANAVNVQGNLGKIIVMHEVDPETVGQYTGLQNVYEKDILKVTEVSNAGMLEYVSRVDFFESGYIVTQPDGTQVPLACFHNLDNSYPLFEIKVIGNVIDNPELLEG